MLEKKKKKKNPSLSCSWNILLADFPKVMTYL